ncbi:MAG: PP2C family protein-serine/threonine phosphatase [bacterium]|nr:PP2C family protein-serine/threonine phosphatase [bacterium]
MEIYAMTNQGGRDYMEDFYFHVENFLDEPGCLLAGIFDGHGGEEVASLAAQKTPVIMAELLKAGESEDQAFKNCYDRVSGLGEFDEVGSTALCWLIRKNRIVVANAGDSSIMLAPEDATLTKCLNQLHNTGNMEENERILKAGGEIEGYYIYYRGSLGLAVSRSLGDHSHRRAGVICEPEINVYEIPASPIFFIAGSDGLWEHIDRFVAGEIAQKAGTAELACKEIFAKVFFNKADDDIEHFDNITLIVIKV